MTEQRVGLKGFKLGQAPLRSCHVPSSPRAVPEDSKYELRASGMSAKELGNKVESTENLLLIDARPYSDYVVGHIEGAFSVRLSSLMTRRLAKGKLRLFDLVVSEQKTEFQEQFIHKDCIVVVYDSNAPETGFKEYKSKNPLHVILKSLDAELGTAEVHRTHYLLGGFQGFKQEYPEHINEPEVVVDTAPRAPASFTTAPLTGPIVSPSPSKQRIEKRRSDSFGPISSSGSGCGSSSTLHPTQKGNNVNRGGHEKQDGGDTSATVGIGHDPNYSLMHARASSSHAQAQRILNMPPSEVLPYLYIGSRRDACDKNVLASCGVTCIVNATDDCPCQFQEDDSFSYLRIPVKDTWNQNLPSHFNKAFEFINQAKVRGEKVMIHCTAGISRSATITIAYIMNEQRKNLNDAISFVRSKRPIIAPNLDFMGELMQFEGTLNLESPSFTGCLVTTSSGANSPDSSDDTASVARSSRSSFTFNPDEIDTHISGHDADGNDSDHDRNFHCNTGEEGGKQRSTLPPKAIDSGNGGSPP